MSAAIIPNKDSHPKIRIISVDNNSERQWDSLPAFQESQVELEVRQMEIIKRFK